MLRNFLLVNLLLFLFACGPSRAELSIPKEKLVKVLADVHIAEGTIQNLRAEQKDSVANIYYEQIFTIHEVSKGDFYQSMEAMRQDPQTMEEVYALVLEELSKMEANVGK